MRRLTLLRHARPESDSPTGRDFDRPLNERGRADAARMGREMRDAGLAFDLVVASPAKRVAETIAAIDGSPPTWDKAIYNATAGELLGIIQEVAVDVQSLMLVGHNPGFEELASLLAGKPIAMSAGALVEIELPIDEWSQVGENRGRAIRFINPKDWD